MVLYEIVKALILPVSLYFLRNGPSYYRSVRASYRSRKTSIKPVPPHVTRALNVLFYLAAGFLLTTLPYFTPENIFVLTNGRLQTSTDVLFKRLSDIRPLTAADEALKSHLTTKDARLLYFTYGPQILTSCLFCTPEDPNSYLYYSLPSLAFPHIFHVAILGLMTSPVFSGREGAKWRTLATIAAALLAATDVWFTVKYDFKVNNKSTKLQDIDFFFWRKRIYRALGFAAVDSALGWAMYLSSTNRFFVTPPSVAERLELAGQKQEVLFQRLWATSNIRNTIVRDRELREGIARYWNIEKQVFEEREVVDSLNEALGRFDMDALTKAAGVQADNVLAISQGKEYELVKNRSP